MILLDIFRLIFLKGIFWKNIKGWINPLNIVFSSVATLPIFKAINIEEVSRGNIIESLLQENLDSFRYQNNTNETNEGTVNNTNNNDSNNQQNLSTIFP